MYKDKMPPLVISNNECDVPSKIKHNPFKFKEKVSKEAVQYLLNFSDAKLLKLVFDGDYELLDQDGNEFTQKDYINQVRCYFKEIQVNNYEISRDYNYGTSYLNIKKGRIYVKGFGIQKLQYKLRGFLCRDIYTDYDIKNCFPTILLNICKKFEDEDDGCSDYILEKYVKKRDSVLVKHNLTKMELLICMFSDKPTKSKNEYLKNFDKEIKGIQQFLYEKYKKEYSSVIKNKSNPKGSLIFTLCSIKENEILQEVLKYCYDNDIVCGCPMYDGMLLEKQDQSKEKELLKTFNNITEDRGIKWTIKEHDTSIQIDEEELNNPLLYKNVKKEFEKKYFITCNPLAYYKEIIHHSTEMPEIVPYKSKEFRECVAPYRYIVDEDEAEFFSKWIADENRREYDTIDFIPPPLKCPDKVYNLFKGVKYQTDSWKDVVYDENINIDMIHNHIKLLCNYDDACYKFVLDFLAHLIKYPAYNPEVVILFKSIEGLGKNIFFDNLMIECLGKGYYKGNAVMNDLIGKFRDNSMCLMAILNELNGDDGFKTGNDDKMKDLITAEYQSKEDKGMKKINYIRNCMRVLIFTNSEYALKLSSTDRRYCLIKGSSDIPPKEYFDKLGIMMKSKSHLLKFIDELKKRDVPTKFHKSTIPYTQYKHDVASITIPQLSRFLQEKLEIKGDKVIKVSRKDFLRRFKHYVALSGNNYSKSDQMLGKNILNNYDGSMIQKRNGAGNYYIIDCAKVIASLKKQNHYEVVEKGDDVDYEDFDYLV